MDIREAARALKMPETTAQSWYKKESENPEEEIGRKKGSGRPVGRPSALREEHGQFLKELIDDKPSLVLEEMIALTITSKATADKKIDWNEFIKELSTTIIDKYDKSPLAKYKGAWKHAFKKIAKEIGIICKRGEDHWEKIVEPHIIQKYDQSLSGSSRKASNTPSSSGSQLSTRDTSSKASSTSSLNYQRDLTVVDKLKLSENYKKINKKWVLNSGTAVEDKIYMKSKEFLYEHPTHSMIMDPKSSLWRSCFSAEDLDEIITYSNSHNELGRPLPTNIEDLLSKLDKKNTFRSIYDEFDAVKADPIYNPEEYWVKRSILDYACLFIENEKVLPRRTEQDLLEDVYGFIKKSYRLSNTTVETASASMYSGENKNVNRTIGSMSKVCRKQSSESADLVFKHLSHKIGCLEIGFNISGLLMTHDRGSIAMIKSTERLHMPESVAEIARLLPPVLKLVYNCAQVMRETTNFINDIASSVALDNNELIYFPPCFVAAEINHKKRKASPSETTEEE
ncbi:hypothetical protein G6F30_010571 [Rhizopus arrhizus]|uniref:Uncharacterized protein n=1 Tax=Rhizopus oryzae TaxID=64495 RepID=A0A9P6X213_RHIOR|nr:hypothetical protein G6F30_010571 [Rhizopus arrhizus]KAG1303599.1 hypothetical protein G6F64_009937 [Rhizopus arrhizus]